MGLLLLIQVASNKLNSANPGQETAARCLPAQVAGEQRQARSRPSLLPHLSALTPHHCYSNNFPVNVGKTHLSSSMGDEGGGVRSMKKGPTHRLQPTRSLISSARLRSEPSSGLTQPSTWPEILSDNFPPCSSLEQGFFTSLPHLAAQAKLLEIVTAKSELVKDSSYGWARTKKEALWAAWLVWALRTDSINTALILRADH